MVRVSVFLSFKQIRRDLDFSDITLAFGDEQIKPHKVVLSSAIRDAYN